MRTIVVSNQVDALICTRGGSEGERKAENPKPSSLELNKTMNILP